MFFSYYGYYTVFDMQKLTFNANKVYTIGTEKLIQARNLDIYRPQSHGPKVDYLVLLFAYIIH